MVLGWVSLKCLYTVLKLPVRNCSKNLLDTNDPSVDVSLGSLCKCGNTKAYLI